MSPPSSGRDADRAAPRGACVAIAAAPRGSGPGRLDRDAAARRSPARAGRPARGGAAPRRANAPCTARAPARFGFRRRAALRRLASPASSSAAAVRAFASASPLGAAFAPTRSLLVARARAARVAAAPAPRFAHAERSLPSSRRRLRLDRASCFASPRRLGSAREAARVVQAARRSSRPIGARALRDAPSEASRRRGRCALPRRLARAPAHARARSSVAGPLRRDRVAPRAGGAPASPPRGSLGGVGPVVLAGSRGRRRAAVRPPALRAVVARHQGGGRRRPVAWASARACSATGC